MWQLLYLLSAINTWTSLINCFSVTIKVTPSEEHTSTPSQGQQHDSTASKCANNKQTMNHVIYWIIINYHIHNFTNAFQFPVKYSIYYTQYSSNGKQLHIVATSKTFSYSFQRSIRNKERLNLSNVYLYNNSPTYPMPTESDSWALGFIPDTMIIAESGTAPSNGRTIPPNNKKLIMNQ